VIHWPGASRLRKDALLLKLETLSTGVPRLPSVVDPTLTALEMHAGSERPSNQPEFPDATTGAMPADRNALSPTTRARIRVVPTWPAPRSRSETVNSLLV